MVWIKHLSGLLKGLRWFVESTKVLSRRVPHRSPSLWTEQPFLLVQNAPFLRRNRPLLWGSQRTHTAVPGSCEAQKGGRKPSRVVQSAQARRNNLPRPACSRSVLPFRAIPFCGPIRLCDFPLAIFWAIPGVYPFFECGNALHPHG